VIKGLKVLVTGATGFIGSHLVESLLEKGNEVRCLIRKTSDLKWLKGLSIETVEGDSRDPTSLGEAVRDVDRVFHLAGVTRAASEETYFEVNAFGTENLIRACLEHNPGLRKFIFLSSQAASGPCRDEGMKRESDSCDPVSLYGQSKKMGEEMALRHSHELPLLILRPSSVYGPRDRDIYSFFKLVSRGIKPCIAGQNQRLSLCFVEDIVEAILLAAESGESKGEIFFISDGNHYSMEEVGDIIAGAMGVRAVCVRVPKWAILGVASCAEHVFKLAKKESLMSRSKAEEMVQKNWGCDIAKAKSLLGFAPRFDFSRGAKLTFEWYKREKWL
jgi:nucleoside-diphosphate-sugar epimerase